MGRLSVGDLAEDHLNAELLVCTELLTNAYDHADGSSQLRLRRNRVPCWVLTEVDDGVAEQEPVVGRSRFGTSQTLVSGWASGGCHVRANRRWTNSACRV